MLKLFFIEIFLNFFDIDRELVLLFSLDNGNLDDFIISFSILAISDDIDEVYDEDEEESELEEEDDDEDAYPYLF